jgi:predicted RNA-binding protein associated with RNAse of E/G family
MPGLMRVLKCNLAGEVTWEYPGTVLHREPTAVTLEAFFNRDDLPLMGTVFRQGDRFVETFYSDRWYNVFEVHDRESGELKGWYCNICKPAVIEEDRVSYVDLALDLWVAPDGRQSVLDEDEFEALGLDEDTAGHATAALHRLQNEFQKKSPPD